MEVEFKKSTAKGKKWTAIFYDKGKKVKTTNFGSKGMDDFTLTKNKEQKERYLNRHKKRENWNSYMTAGSLSRWVLWNKGSVKSSIQDYLKRFKLKLKK